MKAIVYNEFGSLSKGEYSDVAAPELKSGTLKIKVSFAGIIPFDLKVLDKTIPMPQLKFPFIPGAEFAGEVVELADDLNGWEKGDLVCGNPKKYGGAFAEEFVVKADEICKVPAGMSMTLAAACPVSALAAWHGLFDAGKLVADQKVLIVGASGNVGSFAVQFAKQKKATVYAVGSSRYKFDVLDLGADHYLDYKDEGYLNDLPAFDLILDMVGGKDQEKLIPLLKKDATIVSLVQEPNADLVKEYQVHAHMLNSGPNPKELENILEEVSKGILKVKGIEEYPLQAAIQAFEKMNDNKSNSKYLLKC
ncbi:NADP-dependent oxidoreductase [Sphingobacterium sp.]|uniref:NADP-dependent oxidoreductase n=1 Tax=Sphingobacterium sp. TaxID=341027 RepID=UPI0028B0EB08|nr:NADP-dependent oxidoreductase [Sphingobacterium sp.]